MILENAVKSFKIWDCILKIPEKNGEIILGFASRLPGFLNFLVGILDFLDKLSRSCRMMVRFLAGKCRKPNVRMGNLLLLYTHYFSSATMHEKPKKKQTKDQCWETVMIAKQKMITHPSVWLPGYSCQESSQDLVRSWKIIQEIQDSYQEIYESGKPTRKSKDNFPDFVEIFRMQSQFLKDFSASSRIIQDFSRSSILLLKVLNLQKLI